MQGNQRRLPRNRNAVAYVQYTGTCSSVKVLTAFTTVCLEYFLSTGLILVLHASWVLSSDDGIIPYMLLKIYPMTSYRSSLCCLGNLHVRYWSNYKSAFFYHRKYHLLQGASIFSSSYMLSLFFLHVLL